MTTTATKKTTRGTLQNAAKKGQLWVKCIFSLTDDYAYDNANNFGKDDTFTQVYWMPEFVSSVGATIDKMYSDARANGTPAAETHLAVEPLMEQQRQEYEAFKKLHDERSRGMAQFRKWDLTTQSGGCWADSDTTGSFRIHSNLSYRYEIRR